MEPLGHQRQFTMDPPSATSLHASGQASNEDIEASCSITQSGVASSLPLSPVLSPDHQGVKPHSSSDETTEQETELSPSQTIGASKKAKREKQREKRRLKRASKRAATEVGQDNTEVSKKMRHRPSPAQRSASALMRLDHLSRLFPKPSLLFALSLDHATAEAMLKAAEKTWGGKRRKRTFRSTQELDRFVSLKDSELCYLKTTLHRVSVLRQLPSKTHDLRARETFISSLGPLFRAWEAYEDTEIEKHELFEEAVRFYTDIITPCLEAQVAQLRQRLGSACIVKERLDKAEAQLANREEIEYRLLALVEDRTYILPTCPAWDYLGKEMEEIRRALDKSESLADLRKEREHIMVEYMRSLEWE
jgi:hypothetical protein